MRFEHDRLEKLDDNDYEFIQSVLTIYLAQNFAAKRNLTYYTDVAEYLRKEFGIQIEPWSVALANLLGNISESEHKQGNPLLSAVVVNKDTLKPGDGFFKLAKELGLFKGSLNSQSDKDTFFINELNRVFDLWEREHDPDYEVYLRLKKKFEGR